VTRVLLKLEPDAVLVFQGGYFDSRCVVEVARRLGIRVIGVENFMIPGTVVLDDLSGQIINRHRIARLGSELLEVRDVSTESLEKTWHWWHDSLAAKPLEHKTGGVDRPEDLRRELRLPGDGKLLLLLAQVTTDASVVLDSPLFQSQWDFIEAVIEVTRKIPGLTLIIRLHPKEKTGSAPGGKPYDRMTFMELRRRGVLELDNVRVVEDARFNTHSLIKMSDVCVTLNSQSGLEAALLGKPVLVCADAFYGRKGFTWDLGHPAALGSQIHHLLSSQHSSEAIRRRATEFLDCMRFYSLFDRSLSEDAQKVRNFFLRGCCGGT
jgi:capsule polysaccharide export protein KpsC/LpsZ